MLASYEIREGDRRPNVGHPEAEVRRAPRELHGEEREAMWRDVILAEAPEVEKYARKAGRTIPVAILDTTELQR